MGFLANGIAAFLFAVVCIVGIVAGLSMLFGYEKEGRILGVVFLLIAVVAGFGWHWSATHRVVPVNQRWLVINTATGEIDGPVRKSGIIEKPFWFYQIKKYPGAVQQPFCLDFYPALKEGYEVKAHICGVYDAANLDWAEQYRLHNFENEGDMLRYWTDQAKDEVRAVFKKVDYASLNSDTVAVSRSLNDRLTAWLASQGVEANSITLSNWDLTSEEVKRQIDAASAASFQKTVEEQKLAAAEVARRRQLYEVETANLVLQERSKGLGALFASLGITDDNAKAFLAAQMAWMAYAENPPSGVTVVIGADAIAVPTSDNHTTAQPVAPTPVSEP